MIEVISIFDIIKVSVGPSSSHTLGPWKAALSFVKELNYLNADIDSIHVELFGSLAKTGKGHATDVAVILGLLGHIPETIDTESISTIVNNIHKDHQLLLSADKTILFDPTKSIQFHKNEILDFHPNGMSIKAMEGKYIVLDKTYFSIGGGFIVEKGVDKSLADSKKTIETLPFPINDSADLVVFCEKNKKSIAQIVLENETVFRYTENIISKLDELVLEMKRCIYRACRKEGVLPGGLNVTRRAAKMCQNLSGFPPDGGARKWFEMIRQDDTPFNEVSRWLSCFALAVNEENATMGRVVTAPTNGAAGVIPAVMLFAYCFEKASEKAMRDFLLTAGQIGILFKTKATISAAMGGCQAEIGVSSSMAAAGLTEIRGGSVEQVLMAAEIAMEHHLGLTCDPVGGLVQIPCIERNAMGAIKAITASNIALESNPADAKVSLDSVINTMWQTALDMNAKYKETSEGGLAVQISVGVAEC